MPATVESLGIDRLPAEQQLALAHAIWDHIAANHSGSRLTDEQRQELRRRAAEDDADPKGVIPWDQVKAGPGRLN